MDALSSQFSYNPTRKDLIYNTKKITKQKPQIQNEIPRSILTPYRRSFGRSS